MTFRAVIFDLGGVVLGSPLHAFRAYERDLGLADNYLGRHILQAGPGGAWARLERGELSIGAFETAFDAEVAAAGASISTVELMLRVAEASQPRPAMVSALGRLRQAGLKTAALTNNWKNDEQSEKMDLLRGEFHVFIESAKVGLRKPDPRIYELVLSELAIDARECVFLDDIGGNLKPARAMGIHTLKVIDPHETLKELSELLGLQLTD